MGGCYYPAVLPMICYRSNAEERKWKMENGKMGKWRAGWFGFVDGKSANRLVDSNSYAKLTMHRQKGPLFFSLSVWLGVDCLSVD